MKFELRLFKSRASGYAMHRNFVFPVGILYGNFVMVNESEHHLSTSGPAICPDCCLRDRFEFLASLVSSLVCIARAAGIAYLTYTP